jgi:hypothetical protein
MDAIDDFAGNEFAWAVSAALAPIDDTGEPLYSWTAQDLVEKAYDFIVGSFGEEGLEPPSKEELISAVRNEQRDRSFDWIHDHVLDAGTLVVGAALTDAQWQGIDQTIRAANVEPPARAAVDAMIAERRQAWRERNA